LQHAHNPVNWYAWNDKALQKAKNEDKPILVSIGYSACHWCHVMERESFENEETAQIMNDNFINIKIDREERPDIDHIYMDAVQAITGSGGWPLNVFLTPDLKPFYGGTYYPPVRAFNRSSWKEVLLTVAKAFKEKRNEIITQAENLTQHLINTNVFNIDNKNSVEQTTADNVAVNLIKLSDKEWGGFGQAPKFPQSFSILYLLRHYHFLNDNEALNAALLSLDKMMMGGMYDHLGGGFCRYSTDQHWQIPHFEKMLYDNALLINAYCEAYQLTKKEDYANVIYQTIAFIEREMTSPEYGFYSALDADSEDVEGRFYTWGKQEIDELLGDESSAFCLAYNISEKGNWEHTNILWMPEDLEKISGKTGIEKTQLIKQLDVSKSILFKEREKRIRPALDNKILCNWNALMILALCNAYNALGKNEYLQLAEQNIIFIESNLFDANNNLLHCWNNIPNAQHAFLDDYAALIFAYINLYETTAKEEYLLKAKALTEKVIANFGDEQDCFFYFTAKQQNDILIRKIEMYDGATPSGNALMAKNLLQLSIFFDIPGWNERAEQMIVSIINLAEKYPTTFGMWALNFQVLNYGIEEIVVVGEHCNNILQKILNEYIPNKVVQAAVQGNNKWPLLDGKMSSSGETLIYLCKEYSCRKPVESFEEFKNQLTKYF